MLRIPIFAVEERSKDRFQINSFSLLYSQILARLKKLAAYNGDFKIRNCFLTVFFTHIIISKLFKSSMMKQFSSIVFCISVLLTFAINVNAATLSVAGESANVGDEVVIALTAADLPTEITGFQGTLEWDGSLIELQSVESPLLSTMGFNTNDSEKLGFSWGDFPGTALAGINDVILLTFEVLQEGRANIVFTNSPVVVEVTDGAFAPDVLTLNNGFVEGIDPLPVELSVFDATATGNAVRLDWVTDSEVNFEGFEIQRAIDGVNFNGIAWVNARGSEAQGAGYSHLDDEISMNTSYYYRLKMWDWDGTYEYSEIRNARIVEADQPVIQVYPNPAKNRTAIVFENFSDLTNDPVLTTLHDMNGRTVQFVEHDMQDGINRIELNIAGLPVGLYTITIEHAGYYRTEKLVIGNW